MDATISQNDVNLFRAKALVSGCLEGEGLRRGEDYDIDCRGDAPSLLSALTRGADRCQLLLLDVEFGRDNGLELAAALRKKESSFSLIYVTSHRDYVFDSFDTHPLHYLLKPLDPEKLSALIREDYRRRYQAARLYLKAGGRHISLAYQDIYVVEAAQHRVSLHLREGTEEWSGSLAALAPELPGWCFCRCHNSYFINLTHVTELVRYRAQMENGEVIPVSKRLYKDAIAQYIAFLKN